MSYTDVVDLGDLGIRRMRCNKITRGYNLYDIRVPKYVRAHTYTTWIQRPSSFFPFYADIRNTTPVHIP